MYSSTILSIFSFRAAISGYAGAREARGEREQVVATPIMGANAGEKETRRKNVHKWRNERDLSAKKNSHSIVIRSSHSSSSS